MRPLHEHIPTGGFDDDDAVLDAFLEWLADRDLSLYPAQEEAVLELYGGAHVVLDTPTGSGKSMVALALHLRELAAGRRSVYTAPIKALVSEKYRALRETFGPDAVGMMTGDGSVNRDAPILCCTAEILAKMAVRQGETLDVAAVIMDEFHFYGDADRGMAWQLPLLTLPQVQFLLMSATLGDTQAIRDDLEKRTGIAPVVVSSADRPVPLTFTYRQTTLESTLRDLVGQGKAPVYAVHFTQRNATEHAAGLLSTNFASDETKATLKAAVDGFRFDSPFGKTLRRMVLHGVGLHHAGLLPKYRMLVEKLAQKGYFHVIAGTDTLGVGINVPIRTVLFTQLCKFDGTKVDILSARHFKQIAGRAGRKGYDDAGFVVAQAPEWVVENLKLEALIESGAKKRNKVKKKQPPTRGYKHWDASTFDDLAKRPPGKLEARFRVDHSLVLQLLQKAGETLGDGMGELHGLIDAAHVSGRAKARLHEDAEARLDQLIQAGVVEDLGEDSVPRYRVLADLQHDFSLHHSLSLYLLHALAQLPPVEPERSAQRALDVLTQVESILEHPKAVLSAQVNREKSAVIADLKAKGVPYEERLEILEEVSYPKPMADWIYTTFNDYKETRPWLADAPIRPKTIVREMFETQASFGNYVKDLRIERSEGVLLRYLSQVYQALLQNVPEALRTPELLDVVGYLRAMLARVDDSLVSPWEIGDRSDDEATPLERPLWMDPKALRARLRAELYALVRALASGDYDEAVRCVRPDEQWTADAFASALVPYVEERGAVHFDARLRAGWTTQFDIVTPQRWVVRQILVDDDEEADAWAIEGEVDLSDDAQPSGPLIRVLAIGP